MARKNSKRRSRLISFLLMCMVVAVYFFYPIIEERLNLDGDKAITEVTDSLEIHIVDVGQGDCAIISTSVGYILIDAGDKTSAAENSVRSYLKGLGITEISYAILTHPDADHIGSADMVIEEFEVENVIMPRLSEKVQSTVEAREVYTDLMNAISLSETNVIIAEPGTEYELGELDFKILAPNSYSGSDVNNYSIAVRFDFGETSFLFTGDALEASEKEMITLYGDELDCDFFQAGHHGAKNANTQIFLSIVTPDIVAVSCGLNNKYGHPTGEALNNFEAVDAVVYRTDLMGSLVFVSDGCDIVYQNNK